jgi:hypothetical protein
MSFFTRSRLYNKSIDKKIDNLSNDKQATYYDKLLGILEFRDLAVKYGVNEEDFADLPEDQMQLVKQRLYNEMFNKRYKKSNVYIPVW